MIGPIIKRIFGGKMIDETIILFVLDMMQLSASQRAGNGIKVSRITSDSDELFRALCVAYPEKQFARRLSESHSVCYVASLSAGSIAGYAWLARDEFFVDEVSFIFPIDNNSLYIYDCFVAESFRGRGVYKEMLATILQECRDELADTRASRIWIGSSPDNKVSIKGIVRSGFLEHTRIRYVKWKNVFSTMAGSSLQ